MRNLKIHDTGNETNKKDNGRERVTLMLNECHVPAELEERTLKAMTALREFQAEEEAREAERRAQHKTARNFIRAAAAAAALILAVTVTPLRGYVASAAEGLYQAVHNRGEDVSPVNIKKSADGCTVEVVSARLSNEFIYLTFDEDYTEYAAQAKQRYGEASDSPGNLVFSADYAGELSDGEGHAIRFGNDSMALVETTVLSAENENTVHQRKQYKIYLPGLKEFITSKKKTYTLSVTVSPKARYGSQTAETITSLDFSFAPDDKAIAPARSSQTFRIGYSYTVGNVRFDVQNLYVGETESNFAVMLTPTGDLAGQDLRGIDVTCVICESPKGSEKQDISRSQAFLSDNADKNRLLETPAFLCGDVFGEQSGSDPVFVCDGKYYIFVSCDNINAGSRYNYRSILTAAKKSRFRILDLAYSFEKPLYQDNIRFIQKNTAAVSLTNPDTADEPQEKVVYQKLSSQEVMLDKRLKSQIALDQGTLYDGQYYIFHSFKAGGLNLDTYFLHYQYYKEANDPSTEYAVSDDTFRIVFYPPHIAGKQASVDIDGVNGDCCLKEMVFLGEKDGAIVSRFDSWDIDTSGDTPTVTGIRMNPDGSAVPPDKLILGYVRYAIYDAGTKKYTDYVCYHPDFYTDQGVRKEEVSHREVLDDFRDNSFLYAAQ